MTKPEIVQRVNEIREHADDDEKAHRMEDDLRRDFILFIAEVYRHSPIGAMAGEVLRSEDIDFARWCA